MAIKRARSTASASSVPAKRVCTTPRATVLLSKPAAKSRGYTGHRNLKVQNPHKCSFCEKTGHRLESCTATGAGKVRQLLAKIRTLETNKTKRKPVRPTCARDNTKSGSWKKDAKKAYTPANPSRDRGHRGEYIKEVVRSGWKSKTGVDVLGLAATPHTANDALVNAGYSTNIPKRCPLCTTGLLTAPAARSDAGSNPAQLYVRCCANACNARINVLRFCKLPLPIDGKSCSVTPQKVVHYLCTRAKAQYPALPSPTELSRICSIAEEVDQP
jgi:hypothetical protein